MKLLAFDLDGTLTQHKTSIDPQNRALIARLLSRYRIVIVGAGSCARIASQMDGLPVDIIGHYGMQQSSPGGDGFPVLLRNETVPVNVSQVAQRVTWLRERFGLLEFSGETVEIHASGMITLPILGTAAASADKLAYDPDRVKRRAMYQAVCDTFNNYTVVIGGTSSFDIIPHPYNKFFALCRYAAAFGVSLGEILYFGDDYGPGGNDEVVYQSMIPFAQVDDFRRLGQILSKFVCK